MQTLDYLAVIGLVKNAEDRWGGLMTVSGAWVAFRREALRDVGCWNERTAAEDIDLSWRMQAAGWRIVYDRSWIACVEMVPTWRAYGGNGVAGVAVLVTRCAIIFPRHSVAAPRTYRLRS